LFVLFPVFVDVGYCLEPLLVFSPADIDYDATGRDILEPVKKQFDLSYADTWTLAGAVAIEAMGGPKVKIIISTTCNEISLWPFQNWL
jgi:hypothetical protein